MLVAEKQGAVDVITLQGPLNEESRESFDEKIASLAPDAAPLVVLNLSDTPLIDSRGLEALLDARDVVRQRGGAIKIAAATALTHDVLHASGVGGYFEAFGDVRSAVGSFSR